MFRTAYGVVGDHQLAQDLLQEALVKAYVAWPRLRDVTKAEAYVRRTIVTTGSRRRQPSFHEHPADSRREVGRSDETERFATHDVVWQHVCNLPPRQRAALVLRYYEGRSEAETAESLGCSVGTVKSQVAAALGKLRDRIGGDSGVLLPEDKGVTR